MTLSPAPKLPRTLARILLTASLTASLMATLALLPAPFGEAGEVDFGAVRRLFRQDAPSDRAAALRRLAGSEDPRATALLLDGLADEHPYVRRAAAGILGAVDGLAQARLARKIRRLKSTRARIAGARTAALWVSDVGMAVLGDLARDKKPEVRLAALEWLAEDPGAESLALLRGGLGDTDGGVRAGALDALVACEAVEGVCWPRFLADGDARVRLAAIEGSVACCPASREDETAVVAVLHGLDDAVWSNRLRAAELSPSAADRRVLKTLVGRLTDSRMRIREAAHAALSRITGIPFDPDPAVWGAWLEGDGRNFDPRGAREQDEGPGHATARQVPRRSRTVARPRFLDLPLASEHLVFVLDASGSMRRRLPSGERRWDGSVAELGRVLERLGSAHVNIICFADEAQGLYPKVRKLTPRVRREIREFLEGVEPGGQTALFDGVALGLADPAVDTLVVLSDGAPSAGLFFTKTDLLAEVARLNRFRRARIDVIQVASEGIARRWRDVLTRISRDSGGSCIRR